MIRVLIGILMILFGIYLFIPSLSIALGAGAILLIGGSLAVRSGVTGKKMLSGEMRPKEIGKW